MRWAGDGTRIRVRAHVRTHSLASRPCRRHRPRLPDAGPRGVAPRRLSLKPPHAGIRSLLRRPRGLRFLFNSNSYKSGYPQTELCSAFTIGSVRRASGVGVRRLGLSHVYAPLEARGPDSGRRRA